MTTTTDTYPYAYLKTVVQDWDVTDPETWSFSSTVDHLDSWGYSSYMTVETSWTEYADGDEINEATTLAEDFESAIERGDVRTVAKAIRGLADLACWWHLRLLAVHEYDEEFAEMLPEQRSLLPAVTHEGDFEAYADACRAALNEYYDRDEDA